MLSLRPQEQQYDGPPINLATVRSVINKFVFISLWLIIVVAK